MTKFSFPGTTDPRNGANRSEWVGEDSLTTKMITQDETIQDKHTIAQQDYMVEGGFSLISTSPITMGEVLIWVALAPGTPEMTHRGYGHQESPQAQRDGDECTG